MHILDYINNLPLPMLHHWGYLFVFLATALESTPFGIIVPGHAIIIMSGFLAKMKILHILDVMWMGSLGAFLGDFLNYYIGRKYGYNFITKYGKYFFFKKEYFDKTAELMNHHTGKTLIIGRFSNITRSFSPFIAGSSNVPLKKFIFYNLIGAVSWAVSGVLIGFIFGQGYEMIAGRIGRFSIAAIILAVIVVYLFKFINKQRHIFSKYDIGLLSLNIISLYGFFKMAEDVFSNEKIMNLDFYINFQIMHLWNPLLSKIMLIITSLMNIESIIFLSIILFIILIFQKRWSQMLMFFSALGGGMFITSATKIIFHRLRPVNGLITAHGYSFPSNHALASIIFFSLLIYFFKDDINNKIIKYLFIFGNIFIFMLIGFSRIYLNVHWFSDVIAGFSLGLFWTTLIILIFKYTAAVVYKLNGKSENMKLPE
jgi:membrane protein DedA with SNARE-associated domain/membrane-associated phospholipid phosphatase